MNNSSTEITTSIKNENVSSPEETSSTINEEAFDKLNFVLDSAQIDVLRKMRDNLELHRETTQIFRSEVEMKFSVLNDTKFPTPDAKYWQAVREQDVHFSNLVTLTYEFEAEVIKIKNLEDMIHKYLIKQKKLQRDVLSIVPEEQCSNKILSETLLKEQSLDPLDIEEAEIEYSMLQNKIDTLYVEIRKCKYMQQERRRVATNRWREVVTWEKLCAELRPKMKYGILSYEYHQPDSYGLRMARQERIMLDSGAKGSPSEAINITSQNKMLHKLMQEGTLQPDPRELPIERAAREVVGMIDNGNNYISKQTKILPEQFTKQSKHSEGTSAIPAKIVSNEEVDAILGNNPQVPR